MNKFYTINFEAEYTEDNCMQGDFNEETVIKEVEDFLKERYIENKIFADIKSLLYSNCISIITINTKSK